MPLRLKPQRVTARALNQVPVPGGGHQQGELDERLLPLRHGHWALRGAGAHAHRAAPHRRRGRRRASRAVMSDGPRGEGVVLCARAGLCRTWSFRDCASLGLWELRWVQGPFAGSNSTPPTHARTSPSVSW